MNLDNVNTEPFVGYHLFHEQINITIKILSASLNNTMTHANKFDDGRELGRLIAKTDQAWNMPPVWSFSEFSEEQVYGFVSELGVVSAFSALDDFFIGVEAEITRWNSKLRDDQKIIPLKDDEYENSDEKVINFYTRFKWELDSIDKFLPVLKYFRLARNCIAHRNSKASPALCEYSQSEELKSSFNNYFSNKTNSSLPIFETDERVILDPKLAIFSSHLLRSICKEVNQRLICFLGESGILNMATYHGFFKEKTVKTDAYRTPEAILNFILTDRYRVIVNDNKEAIKLAKELKLWNKCQGAFDKSVKVISA